MPGAGGPGPPRRSWSGLRSLGGCGVRRDAFQIGSGAVFEAPAFVAGLDDLAVMGQSIEHGGGHFGVAEDLRPIGESEVRRDDDRGVFVELADEMEQQLRAGLAERQIAEFVDDDEVMTQQGLDDAAAPSRGLFLFELIDEIDEIEEASARSGTDDGGGDGDRQMGLSRAGPADQDQIALSVDEVAGGEFANLPFVDRRALEDESLEVLQHGESGAADAIVDRTGLTMGQPGADEPPEERIEFIAPRQPLAGDLVETGAHAVKLQAGHGVDDLMSLHFSSSLRWRRLS